MNSLQTKKQDGGFTLIELMVVIAIIIVLAGLVAGAIPGIKSGINRKNTQNFLAELQNGIESYKIDNGIYPQVPGGDDDRSTRGLEGSSVLYKSLSGDYLVDDGKVDPDEKIYVQKLDFFSNSTSPRPRVVSSDSNYYIVDTYNLPIRYIADPPNLKPSERTTFNPTFDLWSTGGEEAGSDEFSVKANYITNWTSQ